MRANTSTLLAVVSWLLLPIAACSASGGNGGFISPAPGDAGDGATYDALLPDAGGDAPFWDPDGGEKDEGKLEEPPCSNADLTGDLDHDGWSVAEGDCNDCTALMNPGAYDYPGSVDEDCNGTPDDEPLDCDQGLAADATDPFAAAQALGLCRVAQASATGKAKTWGVLTARYVFPDGSTASGVPKNFGANCQGTGGEAMPPNPLSHGLIPSFGNTLVPQQGGSMLALSSGVARSGFNGTSPSGAHMCTKSGTPSGYPVSSSGSCPNQSIDTNTTAYDGIALELRIRVPTNAKAYSFDFDFFTYEYPDFVCTAYNDFFVALMTPAPPGAGVGGNVSFDSKGDPVSVNNGFLDACLPGTHGGKVFPCPLGVGELDQTGFDGRGSTSWLQTSGPIVGGSEITLRYAIWDMNDDAYDSTVLVDDFSWEVEELPPQTIRPPK